MNSTESSSVLTSEENSSSGLSHEVGSCSEKTALAKLHFLDIDAATTSILSEQDSESEDELGEFVFQPRVEKKKIGTFHQLNFKLNKKKDRDL